MASKDKRHPRTNHSHKPLPTPPTPSRSRPPAPLGPGLGQSFKSQPSLNAPHPSKPLASPVLPEGSSGKALESRLRAIEKEASNHTKKQHEVSRHLPRLREHENQHNSRVRMIEQMRKSMSNAFLYKPPTLGFDSLMVPKRGMAYLRTSITLNADGSGFIVANPNFANFLFVNTNPFTTLTSTLNTSWTAATNKTGDALEAAVARPLALTLKAWPDVAATSVPGRTTFGCLNYQPADYTFPNVTAYDSSGTPTAGNLTGYGLFPCNTNYSWVNGTGSSSDGVMLNNGNSTSKLIGIPQLKEQVGFKPVVCSWKPSDLQQTEMNSMYAGGIPTKVFAPSYELANTASPASIGGATNTTCITSPITFYEGPYCVASFDSMPASSVVFVEVFYEFEYLSDTLSASPSPTLDRRPTVAADLFPSKESFYREVLSQEPERKEPPQEKESFFGTVGKAISSFINSPIGSLVLDGITMLFGAKEQGDHKVYRSGNSFLLVTPNWNRFLTSREIEVYLQDKAVTAFRDKMESKEVETIHRNSITPSEADALEDFQNAQRIAALVAKVKPTSRIPRNE